MEFPFGHHHKQDRDEETYQPPSHHHHHHEPSYPPQPTYPPPSSDFNDPPHHPYQQPPPPQPHYNAYQQDHNYQTAPPPAYNQFATGPPSYPPVQHVSHNPAYDPDPFEGRHETHHRPHVPSFVHHQTHESHAGGGGPSGLSNKPSVRVYTKAEQNYSLSIREGKVVLARSDPNDQYQHWIKEMKYSTKVKDEEGFPSFALVNKATGQAIKHSIGATHPVQLIPFNPDVFDESILWTESHDVGDTFRCIRMVNNIRLNFDAFHGDKNHGGVHDGTTVVLWEWLKGENQRWKIVPY